MGTGFAPLDAIACKGLADICIRGPVSGLDKASLQPQIEIGTRVLLFVQRGPSRTGAGSASGSLPTKRAAACMATMYP